MKAYMMTWMTTDVSFVIQYIVHVNIAKIIVLFMLRLPNAVTHC